MYGSPLPQEIRQRLDKELNSIIDNGYAVMYRSAELLVKKNRLRMDISLAQEVR